MLTVFPRNANLCHYPSSHLLRGWLNPSYSTCFRCRCGVWQGPIIIQQSLEKSFPNSSGLPPVCTWGFTLNQTARLTGSTKSWSIYSDVWSQQTPHCGPGTSYGFSMPVIFYGSGHAVFYVPVWVPFAYVYRTGGEGQDPPRNKWQTCQRASHAILLPKQWVSQLANHCCRGAPGLCPCQNVWLASHHGSTPKKTVSPLHQPIYCKILCQINPVVSRLNLRKSWKIDSAAHALKRGKPITLTDTVATSHLLDGAAGNLGS